MPSRPRAPSTLSRAQGPRGTLPGARVPRGPRPCSRAMSVSTPHSSRNTNRSGATPPTPVAASVAHTARAAATAASSCSAARKVRFFHVQPHRRSARPTVQGWTRTPVRSASRSRHSARVRWFVSPSRPRSAAATSPLIFGFGPPPILLAARRPSSPAPAAPRGPRERPPPDPPRPAPAQRYAVERPTANRRAAASGVSPASIAARARSRRSVEYDPAIGTSVPYMGTAVPTFTRYALVLQPRFGRSVRQEVPSMTDVNEAKGWARALDELMGRLGPRFGRGEPRRRALAYLRGLLAPVERKNGWQLAEAAGDRAPDGMQDFLGRMRWDADAVRDDLRAYV